MVRRLAVFLLLLQATFFVSAASAHEPYVTDDPDTLDLHHYEVFIASQTAWSATDYSGNLPYFEFNYGALPDFELHIQLPLNYDRPRPGGSFHYGYGDTELGFKWRFLDEDKLFAGCPEIAFSPLFEIPTGNHSQGLGNGQAQYFLPIFAGKTWGPENSQTNLYGGAGYWINLGSQNRNFTFFGAVLQHQFTHRLTLGGELYHFTSEQIGQSSHTGFNLGAIFSFTENFYALASAGRDIQGDNRLTTFLGVQWAY